MAAGDIAVPGSAGAAVVTYSDTETFPVPPASSYAGSGGGDGWGLAFSATQVFNVFHHSTSLTVACHLQLDASQCYSPETITDPATAMGFTVGGHAALWMDQASGRLYAYATRTDATAGVVCIDTTQAMTNLNPFCGFTALTSVGSADLVTAGYSTLSDAMHVGSRVYAVNYAGGHAVPDGDFNRLLCFDMTTHAACGGQPFALTLGAGTMSTDLAPGPGVAVIGGKLIVTADLNGAPNGSAACFDPATQAACSGSWPVQIPAGYVGSDGAPFPLLSATAVLSGFCLPDGVDECFDLSGNPVATPPNMASAVGATSPYNGQAVILGPRVYVPDGNADAVDCYDAATAASCAQFPHSVSPGATYMYTVNADPARPTCLWVNSDSGTGQIQNFDAYTGGACGQGAIRVLASSFIVSTPVCQPASYVSLQIGSPARSSYTTGSVSFEDADANPLPGLPTIPLDANGTANLSGLNLTTAYGLPQFLITLNGVSGTPTSLKATLTWTGTDDPSCYKPGSAPPPKPFNLVAYPVTATVGKPFVAANGTRSVGAVTVQTTLPGAATPSSASIAWGDGTTSAGTIVAGPVTASQAVFFIQATHKYAAPTNNATLTVTAQVGTATLKASAPVVVLTDRPQAYFIVNPALGTQNQVSLLMPVTAGPGQNVPITGYRWEFADGETTVYDNVQNQALFGCTINGLIQSGGTDGAASGPGCPTISSLYDGAIQLGILPTTTRNFIGGLTSTDILTIANLWKQYFPQHIIPHVWPYYSETQTSHVAISLGIGVPGQTTPGSCLGIDNAVCYTVPSVTLEPDCTPFTAIGGFSSTCTLSDFAPRSRDYVAFNFAASASAGLAVQGALSLVVSNAIFSAPSSDDVFIQVSVGGGLGLGGGVSVSETSGWVNGPFSSAPTWTQTNDFIDRCTISGGAGLSLGIGSVSLGGGYQGVDSPGGDPGFTSGFETFTATGGAGSSAIVGLSVNYALSLSELGIPLSAADLQAYKDLFTAATHGSVSGSTLASDAKTLLTDLPGAPSAIKTVTNLLAAAQGLNTACGKL